MNVNFSRVFRLVPLLALIAPLPCLAKFTTVDEKGNEVEIKVVDTPYRQFQRTYSFATFQLLDKTDREYALPEALIASLDPSSKLTSDQRIGLRHVLSQYYETMSQSARETIERKVFWMAFLSGQPALGQKVAERFLSPYADQRAKQLCTLVRDSTQMLLYKGEKPTIHYLMKLGAEPMGLLATLIDSNRQIGNEKCPLGVNDNEPLSLMEMRAEIIKAGLIPVSKDSPSDKASAHARTPCLKQEIKSIFADAITSIERTGPKTKVYLGMHAMTCPIYGLVTRDPKSAYRYYANTYREDVFPAVTFKNADDIAAMFQIVTTPRAQPAATKNATGTAVEK